MLELGGFQRLLSPNLKSILVNLPLMHTPMKECLLWHSRPSSHFHSELHFSPSCPWKFANVMDLRQTYLLFKISIMGQYKNFKYDWCLMNFTIPWNTDLVSGKITLLVHPLYVEVWMIHTAVPWHILRNCLHKVLLLF